MAFQHCITPKPNNAKPLNLNDMNKEEIRKTAWESVGDEKLFPNHSDKDIWNNGFDACYNILSTTSQTHKAMSAEDNDDWLEKEISETIDLIEVHSDGSFDRNTATYHCISAAKKYASQFQPLPVGGKSVEEIEKMAEMYADEFYDKNDSEDSVKWENRKHNFIAGYKATQQPVSDGVEKGEWFSMDEHAQIMAIDFANWLLENVYSVNGCWYLNEGMSGEIYTTEHLYTIFKNRNQSSKIKNNSI